jgi:hypothetical protein
MSDKGALPTEPIHILDRHSQQLRRHLIDQVKVQWDSYSPNLAAWKDEIEMCYQFLYLF